jgi:chromate transport protein ChrA
MKKWQKTLAIGLMYGAVLGVITVLLYDKTKNVPLVAGIVLGISIAVGLIASIVARFVSNSKNTDNRAS